MTRFVTPLKRKKSGLLTKAELGANDIAMSRPYSSRIIRVPACHSCFLLGRLVVCVPRTIDHVRLLTTIYSNAVATQ